MQDSLCNWRHGAPYSLHILGFFVSVWTVFVWMSFTTHNTFLFFSTILCLVPETLALETLLDRGCYSKFLAFFTILVIMDYVRSNKGGMKLLFQNNLYVKQKVLSSGAVCWECDRLLWGYMHWKTSSWWTSQSTVIWSGSLEHVRSNDWRSSKNK